MRWSPDWKSTGGQAARGARASGRGLQGAASPLRARRFDTIAFMKRFSIALLASLGFAASAPASSQAPAADPVGAFWAWFVANEGRLFQFEPDRDPRLMAQLFDQLELRLHRIDPGLAFEFSGAPIDGVREFVISAEGVRALIPVVLRVQREAPDLPRWRIIAFRQRGRPGDLEWNGERIAHAAVRVAVGVSDKPGMLDLIVFLPGRNDREQGDNISITYLLLDNALGEFDVMTKVGYIEAVGLDDDRVKDSVPIAELPPMFDAFYAIRQEHPGPDDASDK